ncbi:MAG: ankyrin repeat domain-containing protein [Sphingomonadaceae bacterium]|nr:ankyrin repeat domain-containing protein [Sphingomonadaceae bacterium]
MPRLIKLPLALALAAPLGLAILPAPAFAQFSESYKFLEAVKKKEGQEVTDMLAKGGPNLINTRDVTSGETALHIVTARRDLTWMRFLIERGASVHVRDVRGATPLVIACNLNFTEGVELLVENGARVDESNNSGETPLITAVHNRNLPLMRILLKAGADPDRADNSGRSARDYAKLAGNPALLSTIESEAKPKAKPGQGPQIFGPKL